VAHAKLGLFESPVSAMESQTPSRRIEGSCHCGNIRFTFDWPGPGPTIPVRACDCTLCTKHGGVWTSHPKGSFRLQIADDARVSCYRFGTKTADFNLCLVCGVIPIVTCVIDGTRYAVVNVNTFDNVDRAELIVSRTDFESETAEDRLARRTRKWTPKAAGDA
jgi:hypothetical protein